MWLLLLGKAWGFLKSMPWQVWAGVAAFVILGGWHLRSVHAHVVEAKAEQAKADKALIDASNAQRDAAMAANLANNDTITALQQSQALCESGRIADNAAQAKAMAAREKAATVAQAAYAKARAELDAVAKGRCSSTAKRAVCGATP